MRELRVTYITAQNIEAKHAFTTRYGGVSSGVYSSLNLGINLGDDPECVRENYAVLCAALSIGYDCIVRSNQVHGNSVRVVTPSDCGALFNPPACDADAMITCETGVALIIYTADCVPILLHDPVRCVIGAVHGGWRGSAANICGTAIRRMQDEFGCVPADIHAAIGPCIGGCCYEVGSDVADALRTALTIAAEGCIEADVADALPKVLGNQVDLCIQVKHAAGKYMVDLGEANRIFLQHAGVTDISMSRECTMCSHEKYWSHRYTGGKRGSQAALIIL